MSDDRQHWDYLDKIFSDNYKKEIDQEENVWRTLPFFSATIAFELAATAQVRDHLLSLSWPISFIAALVTIAFSASVVTMLCYLWASIRPRQLFYLAPETSILEFAREVENDLSKLGPITAAQAAAIHVMLQDHVMEQWAMGATKNREVNKRRAQLRSRGARILLLSIFIVLTLIGLAVIGPYGGQPAEHFHAKILRAPPTSSSGLSERPKSRTRGFKGTKTCFRVFPGVPENAGCDDRLDL